MMRRLHRWGVSRHKLRGGFLHSKLGDRVLESELWIPTRESLARAWLVGIPVTTVPFLPGQTIVACAIGFLVRANLPVCFLLQYLSNPATAFIQLPACYFTGRYIIGLFSSQPMPSLQATLRTLEAHPFSVALWGEGAFALYLGGFVLGPLLGLFAYGLTHLLWKEKPKRRAANTAMCDTATVVDKAGEVAGGGSSDQDAERAPSEKR